MKKFLVLSLVLGIASLATAGLSLVADSTELKPSDTTIVRVVNDEAKVGGAWVFVRVNIGGPGEWTGAGGIGGGIPQDGSQYVAAYGLQPDFGGDIWEAYAAVAATDPIPAGEYAWFEFHCTGKGDVTIDLLADDLATVLDSITISQVPEPATMALLGLGALVLRRKK